MPLSDEILEYSSEEDLPIDLTTQNHLFEGGSSFLLRPDVWSTNLTHLHPYPVRIFQLWQKFVDNVNPLVKILHIPMVQKSILSASGDLTCVSKQTEALMFSIYSLAVTFMTDVDCENMMGEQRSTLLSRYHNAAKQALMVANWIKSSNLLTLQAFTLLLMSLFFPRCRPSSSLPVLFYLGNTPTLWLGFPASFLVAKTTLYFQKLTRRTSFPHVNRMIYRP